MDKSIKVGIIISCFDNENTIVDCVQSALAQDYPYKEIIIFDNQSIDNSWKKICQVFDQQENIGEIYGFETPLVMASRNEFEETQDEVFMHGINYLWKKCEAFCLLKGNETFLSNKLSLSIDYVEDVFDQVGIIYSDYEKLIGNIPVTVYEESISPPTSTSFLITKHSLEQTKLEDITIADLYGRVSDRYMPIHIPEVLTCEKSSVPI